MTRLAKLTALFQEGMIVVLDPPGEDPMPFWVNKLNPFESEACTREGRVARARRMLAIQEIGTPDSILFEGSAAVTSDEGIIEAMVAEKGNDHFLAAARGIRSDPDWAEKVEVIEHTDDAEVTDQAEVEVLSKIATEYGDELTRRMDIEKAGMRRELLALKPERLRVEHKRAYVEQEGLRAFIDVQRRWQIYYSLRECVATQKDGAWDHTRCKHRERTLADVAEVEQLPEVVLTPVSEAMQKLTMAPDLARFTGALASSSASSESSSNAVDSKDSGPVETSREPVTTSS